MSNTIHMSALILKVPQAEALLQQIKEQWRPAAANAVPAHITLLYPFVPPAEIDTGLREKLEELFASVESFHFTLEIRDCC